jgi:hypothetical protein
MPEAWAVQRAAPVIYSREEILSQIFADLMMVSGAMTVCRNRGRLQGDKLPAVYMFDGREEAVPTRPDIPAMKTVRMLPVLMKLQPEIFVVAVPRDDSSNQTLNGVLAPIGPEMSMWRDAVLNALINEPALVAMLAPDGQIMFRGTRTDLHAAGAMTGQMQIMIEFHYLYSPSF